MNKYQRNIEWFRNKYWQSPKVADEAIRNGFQIYPKEIYDRFLPYITDGGKILDLGCGTGLLLKHIIANSVFDLEPFGVDFLEEAISQAQELTFPEHCNNFFCCEISEYITQKEFQWIIFEPSLVLKEDRSLAVKKLTSFLSKNGSIIMYSYHDSMHGNDVSHLSEYLGELLRTTQFSNYHSYQDQGLDICCIK